MRAPNCVPRGRHCPGTSPPDGRSSFESGSIVESVRCASTTLANPRLAAKLVPQTKQPFDGGKHVAGKMHGVRRGSELPDSLEGALQVSPAELGHATVVTQVGRTTVRAEDAGECLPQQLHQHLHAPTAGDVVEHKPRGAQRPNPAFVAVGTAAGFVAV